MLTDRCNCCGMGCRSKVTAWIIGISLFLVALVVGAIIGSYFSGFVLENIVAIVIFGIVLLLAAIFTALFARCRCNE
ncbi:MAG: hypothetical protein J6A78_04995 [Clostridia bacterium]|nr:hypothetical protein [Oscillospiraceae bacterium]MBO5358659.1 hypothetical protein [Clostridia bacterium]